MNVEAHEARGALLLALRGAGVRDLAVLRAMEAVSREEFLPHRLRDLGNRNIAVPIACGQTMPPPLSLAQMLEALAVRPGDRVLEVGTGTGYATAVLARLAGEIVSFERYRTLAAEAETRLRNRGVPARVITGDGLAFSTDIGRFERAIVHATIASVPDALANALTADGRIVSGVPGDAQGPAALAVWERAEGGAFVAQRLTPIRLPTAQSGVATAL